MTSPSLPTTRPYDILEDGLTALVRCLALFLPMHVWMVTRVHGNDGNVLVVEGPQDAIPVGAVFHWPDSYCSQMVAGRGPCFAPDAQAISAYAATPLNKLRPIGAYIGLPLLAADGALMGTLCAMSPAAVAPFTPEQQYLAEQLARTMSTFMNGKLALEQLRQAEANLRYLAELDSLTGLANRHSWELALADEESALQGLGENAMVMMVDLDGLKEANDTKGHAFGDQYIVAAAHTLRAQLREIDIVARLGGDEFGVIVRNATAAEANKLHDRIKAAFREAGVEASTGYAMRLSCRTLADALAVADCRMYEDKSQRKHARAAAAGR